MGRARPRWASVVALAVLPAGCTAIFGLDFDPTQCGAGTSPCSTGCVDLTTDTQNCGTCGHACGDGMACQGGMCGAGGQSASSTSSSSSGAGGGTPCGGCGAGTVCMSGMCVTCSSLDQGSTFSFGMAQPIAIANAPAAATFPRLDKSMSSLFFVDANNQIELATMGSSEGTWGGPAVLAPPYNTAPTADQEGPLPWTDASSLLGIVDATSVKTSEPILLFGSQRTGGQALYAANLEMPPPSSASELTMPPFALGDRSIAVAFNAVPARAFWLRGGHVWTVTTGVAGAVSSQMTIAFDGGCTLDPLGAISDPWVSPDGSRLLFSAPFYSGSGCTLATGSQARLFYVDLDPGTGKPTGPATQIFALDSSDDDRTPSLAEDSCTLYFSRAGTLTQAPRQ